MQEYQPDNIRRGGGGGGPPQPNNISYSINDIDEGGGGMDYTPISLSGPPQQQMGGGGGGASNKPNIDDVMNAIQEASSTGATRLPSRDIPQDTFPITQDPNIQVDYIPRQAQQRHQQQPTRLQQRPLREGGSNRYIENDYDYQEDINDKRGGGGNSKSFDDIYSELQIPALLAILFFIFQLPFMKKGIFMYAPFFFHKDGNWNLQGLIFHSGLFGLIYYVIQKIMSVLNG